MKGWPIHGTLLALQFEFLCKCGSEKFLLFNSMERTTILCTQCERKYEVLLDFKEIF